MKFRDSLLASFCVLVLAFAVTNADEPLVESTYPRGRANSVMDQIAKDNLDTAFEMMTADLITQTPQFEVMKKNLERERLVRASRWGKSLGQVEFVGESRVGRSFVCYTYLEKFERHALVWKLTYYKPQSTWGLFAVKCNDNPASLLKDR